ncbi:MAG: hypothetical protein RIC95_04835 [Vicingaceae bacterium]
MLALLCLCFGTISLAQDSSQVSAESIPYIRFQYGYLNPGGDFEDRYGISHQVGGALGIKLASNWQFEIEGMYHFGGNVKTRGFLNDIINEAGDVIDSDGELIKLVYELRGLSIYASAGKVFPWLSTNPNSGVMIQAGIGYLQHRTKVDYRDGDVFQLSDEMLKGYDRLHTGISSRQFVGYQYFGKRNLLNFYLGFEVQQGFTKNRRKYNYDTRSFDTEQKLDLLYGFRFGWTIPFRSRTSDEFYYY